MSPLTQQIIEGTLRHTVNGFLIERQSRGRSKRTIGYYRDALRYFAEYLDTIGVVQMGEITPDVIRRYIIELGSHRNPGGQHAAYRAIKALFMWFEEEFEPEGWKNPIRKVKVESLKIEPLPGNAIGHIQLMMDKCDHVRDKAILMFLVDTGVRGSECVGLSYSDFDPRLGGIVIHKRKGDKFRVVFLGKKAKRELLRYLKTRENISPDSPLFATFEEERLSFSGLHFEYQRRELPPEGETPGWPAGTHQPGFGRRARSGSSLGTFPSPGGWSAKIEFFAFWTAAR